MRAMKLQPARWSPPCWEALTEKYAEARRDVGVEVTLKLPMLQDCSGTMSQVLERLRLRRPGVVALTSL